MGTSHPYWRIAHGKSKEARSTTQEEFETRQGKCQACTQVRKERDSEKSEIQGSARAHGHEEISGQEKAAARDNGKETSRRGAGKHGGGYNHRRHRAAEPRCGCCYRI